MNASQGGEEGQGGQYFLARMGEQLLMPGLPPAQPAPAGIQYKRCNCKKAKCLKLYCVCFGAGVYCQGCNCVDCSNVPEKQHVVFQERQRVLQREPLAFSSKVVGPAHFKGCKCRKSRCVKKYCDCFDAKVRCSEICKCKDCQNQPHNFPGASGAAAVTIAHLPQQQHTLLTALQQQQQYPATADGMEVDLSALARAQLMQQQQQQQQEFTPSELAQHLFPGSHPNSQPASQPPSQPGSRAVSPAPGNVAALQSSQISALQGVLGHAQRQASGAAATVMCAVAAAGSSMGIGGLSSERSSASGGPAGPRPPLLKAGSALHRALSSAHQSTAMTAAAAAAWPSLDQVVGLGSEASSSLPMLASTLQYPQPSLWQQQQQEEQEQHQQQPRCAAGMGGIPDEAATFETTATAGAPAYVTARLQDSQHRDNSEATEQPLACAEDGLTESTQQEQEQRSREPSVSVAAITNNQIADATATHAATGMTDVLQSATGADLLLDLAAEAAAAEEQQEVAQQLMQSGAVGLATTTVPAENVQGADLRALVAADTHAACSAQMHQPTTGAVGEQQVSCLAVTTAASSHIHKQQHPSRSHAAEQPAAQAFVHQPGHGPACANEARQEQQLQQNDSSTAAAATQQNQLQHEPEGTAAIEAEDATAITDNMHQRQRRKATYPWVGNTAYTQLHHESAAVEASVAASDSAAVAAANLQDQLQQQQLAWSTAPLACHALSGGMGMSSEAMTAAAGVHPSLLGLGYSQGAAALAGLPATVDPSVIIVDPSSAAQLAQNAGLGEEVAMAAQNAAKFLRDVLIMSTINPAASGSCMGLPTLQQQQEQPPVQAAVPGHKEQPQFSRLRHGTVYSPAVTTTSSQVAVLTGQPLAAMVPSAAAAGGQHVHATPQAVSHAPSGGVAVTAASGGAMFSGLAAAPSLARSLSSMAGVASTPSPVTGHALRQACSSFRGPSPLGPVSSLAQRSREAAGLQALIGSGKQQHQPGHGTPVGPPPSMQNMAPGSGTSSAAGGPVGSSSARRSMMLLPGSFRLSGATQSPAVSHGSPATAPIATSAMLAHAFGSHLAPSTHKYNDSPAGSISLAPSMASAGPADAQTAVDQEQTPVFSNSLKAQQLLERHAKQHLEQLDQVEQQEQQQEQQSELPPDTCAHNDNAAPAVATAAGAQTPLSELALAGAAAGTSVAPTPTFWQQQAQQATELDQLVGLNLFSSQVPAGHSLHDMTPSSLFIASLLASGSTPTDMFLTSPMPQIASVLRPTATAAAGGGPMSGVRPRGIRGGEVTPVLLDIGHHALGSASTGACRRGGGLQRGNFGRAKSGVGVSALCTGWSSEGMAAPAPVHPPNSSSGGGPVAAVAAAAGAPGSQTDAPASGMKADTDKAAARAVAAAAGDAGLHHAEPTGIAGDACDAGVSSLLAAANFISTPGFDDEVPAKRRRREPGSAQDYANDLPATAAVHNQSHSKQQGALDGNAFHSSQELDVKHAADAAASSDKFVAVASSMAAAVCSDAAHGSDVCAHKAQARRALLPAKTAAAAGEACNKDSAAQHINQAAQTQQQQQQMQQCDPVLCAASVVEQQNYCNSSQRSQQQQQSEWGSQADANAGVCNNSRLSLSANGIQELPRPQAEQQQQQQQRGQKRSRKQLLQQKHSHLLHPVHDSMEIENLEPHLAAHKASAATDVACNGAIQQWQCKLQRTSANAAGTLHSAWRPGSPAGGNAALHKHTSATAKLAAAAAAVAVDQDAGVLQSPPVTIRPAFAVQGTDRSPSIESFAAADAMLALCDPLHFRQR